MGIRDGLVEASVPTKIAFLVIFLAVVVNWIAFCTTSWYVFSDGTYTGLWRYSSSNCGIKLDDSTLKCGIMLDGSPDDDLNAIQAFGIFGFMGLNVGFVLILLYMFWGSCKRNAETGMAAAIALLFSASSWLISVAIFGAKYDDYKGRFGYSYALAVCALILAWNGGVIMLIGRRGNNSTSLK